MNSACRPPLGLNCGSTLSLQPAQTAQILTLPVCTTPWANGLKFARKERAEMRWVSEAAQRTAESGLSCSAGASTHSSGWTRISRDLRTTGDSCYAKHLAASCGGPLSLARRSEVCFTLSIKHVQIPVCVLFMCLWNDPYAIREGKSVGKRQVSVGSGAILGLCVCTCGVSKSLWRDWKTHLIWS